MVGDSGENLLFGAGDGRTAELLLKAGVNPNHLNNLGRTPLTYATKGEVAQKLIEGGAKITGLNEPLVPQMVQLASADAVEAVLKAGADQDLPVLQKALLRAAGSHKDKAETAAVLLKYGAKANEPGEYGSYGRAMLPLLACCVDGSPKTAKLLIEHGADPNAGDRPGEMLQTALSNGHKHVADVLRKAGARGASELAFYVFQKDEASTERLLSSAPSYSDDPAFWGEVLSTAARIGDVRTVKAALKKGVSVKADYGKNAYEAAAWEGQHEVLAVLLGERKADADPAELKQSLWAAVWNSYPYEKQRPAEAFEKTVKLLIDAGVPVTGREGDAGLVANAVFTRNPGGNPRVVEMLVAAGAEANPTTGENERLSDVLERACAQGGCPTPLEATITAVERLAKVSINREKK